MKNKHVPTQAELLSRLHKLPKEQRQYLLRQAGILQTNLNLGPTASLELLYKLGTWINRRDLTP